MDTLYKRGFPDTKFLDDQPFWDGRVPWPPGGTNLKHQQEKEARERREEEAASSSPVSCSSYASQQTTQVERN